MNGMAYVMVVLGILLAKGLGFLRDIFFASVFGASVYTDMYFQIFGLVNLIFTGIGVALSTLVIKNLNKAEHSGEEENRGYVSHFIRKTTLVCVIAAICMAILARPIVSLLLPGLDGENIALAVKLMYVMLPSFVFVIIAYIISGVLQNNKVFFISSVMSLPFNIVIIGSLFVKNIDIMTVSIVTTIGWLLHIVIQLPAFYKKGYRLFSCKYNKPSQKSKGRNELLWIFISNMMFQVCFMIDKAFVTGESGAASTINYASNLFVTIASVFVVAMSNVVFPSISRNYEEGNIGYVKELFQYMVTIMFSIFLPFILVTVCFGENIISLLYERGSFTGELVKSTAVLFAVYTIGVFGYACQELFNKILYLDSKYSYTVAGTLGVIVLKFIVNFLIQDKGAVSIAASTTVLFVLYAVVIAVAIGKVTGNYIDKPFVKNLLKILLASIAAFIVFVVFRLTLPEVSQGKFSFILPLCLCGIVYCIVLFVSGIVKVIIKGRNAENPQ